MEEHEDHYHDPELMAAREELTEALKKYSKLVDSTNHVLLGGTVVWETTAFDDTGHQMYYTQHVILDPSSLSHAVGLLDVARNRLIEYINR